MQNCPVHNQINPKMPFPWPNSIQITVFVCEKPSEKAFRTNDLMLDFAKQYVHKSRIYIIQYVPFPNPALGCSAVSLPRLSHFLGLDPEQPVDPWLSHRPHKKKAILFLFLGMASLKIILHLSHPFFYPRCVLKGVTWLNVMCFFFPSK
jgi:hypothetical protein